MKKLIAVCMVLAVTAVCLFAQEQTEDKWSDMSYFSVPILKIYEARNGYLVVYQKNHIGIGSTVIPKVWAKGNAEKPKKLKFRATTGTLDPYMSVILQNGEFLRVILTVPNARTNPVWGVARPGDRLDDADKDSLENLSLYN